MAVRQRGRASLKLLDRALGVPLIWGIGRFRRHRVAPRRVETVGILKLASLGDTILLSGSIADLRRHFSRARLVFFSGETNFDVTPLIPGLDGVVRLPVLRPIEALPLLRREAVDLLFDFGPWARVNAFYSALSGARHVVGFETPGQSRHHAYDSTTLHSGARHEIENHRALVRSLGIEAGTPPTLGVPPGQCPLPEHSYVIFHACAGGYRSEVKEWAPDRWVDLAGRVIGTGLKVVFTGSRDDRTKVERIASRLPGDGVLNMAGRGTFSGSARLVAGARAAVSVNTSVMHLAAAYDVPLVSLEGPTSAARWGPLGDRCTSIEADAPGCGYINLGFEYAGRRTDCMEFVDVERVWAALEGFTS